MPISPFKPIEIIQTEIHNRLTAREKEDRLHSELRGEDYEFVIEEDGDPKELSLSIVNIGLDHNDSANLGLRLQNYECPTSLDDWEEDLTYLYINSFLRGKGSAAELGNPLMADLSAAGYSPHDVRISMWVSTTAQSGIWDAVGRVALIIAQYHKEWFAQLQEIEAEYADQYKESSENIPMQTGVELAEHLENHNPMQAYGTVLDYIQFKNGDKDQARDGFDSQKALNA